MCLFIPKSHVARTVPQDHDHVELEVKMNGGNCDQREAVGSRQEVRDRSYVKRSQKAATVQWAVSHLPPPC